MAKTVESPAIEPWTAKDVLRELEARSGTLTNADIFDLLAHLPRKPSSWSSADVIRELRGPLPEDDPDFADVDRR
ncbi:MAG TPA: hypothetical protein VGQ76_18035 [Thermoanaerobaculia bacterium]|jgi:hypothetical protein|nr:hypothetical protein [Thermoanaerobaculia bacterium]